MRDSDADSDPDPEGAVPVHRNPSLLRQGYVGQALTLRAGMVLLSLARPLHWRPSYFALPTPPRLRRTSRASKDKSTILLRPSYSAEASKDKSGFEGQVDHPTSPFLLRRGFEGQVGLRRTRRPSTIPPNSLALALSLVLSLSLAFPSAVAAKDKLHVVAVSHLDTQWWWDIQTTIKECIPATFAGTFEQFEKYPDYVFSWEGANRYKLLEEYYPELFDQLIDYAAKGRWFPAGSSLEAGDVNIPSPEALLRNFLYGNRWFEQNLGMRSVDVFLPDCFGFGAALPTVAAHCGLTGFSTQKLGWGSAIPVLFSIGVWKGVDGSGLVSALNPGSYIAEIDHDLSYDAGYMAVCSTDVPGTEDSIGYRYFGTGDQGGPVPEDSVSWLQESIESDGPIEVMSVRSDQLFRDLMPEQVAGLPTYQGELILTTHGTGSYTSQALMKRLNRKNELLADAAERANVAAAWLGAVDYPADKLTDAWERFLVHHFHDDLTGTGIPEIYQYSWKNKSCIRALLHPRPVRCGAPTSLDVPTARLRSVCPPAPSGRGASASEFIGLF